MAKCKRKAASYTLTPDQISAANAIVAEWNSRRNEARKGMIAAAKRRGEVTPQLLIAKADVSEVVGMLLSRELEALFRGR
jgi:hypothetical protein